MKRGTLLIIIGVALLAVAFGIVISILHDGLSARATPTRLEAVLDRKSTRLNSSHSQSSYAVFCLKKQNYHQHSAQQVSRKNQNFLRHRQHQARHVTDIKHALHVLLRHPATFDDNPLLESMLSSH